MPNTEPHPGIFAGKRCAFGGLSNLYDLVAVCPEKFKQPNPWSDYVVWFRYHEEIMNEEILTFDWEWKTADLSERHRQLSCLRHLCDTNIASGTNRKIEHKDLYAVAAWMFDEMLNVVPVIIVSKQNRRLA